LLYCEVWYVYRSYFRFRLLPVYFPHRTFVSDVSEIPISFPFPELQFSILFPIKNMKTVMVLVFTDRFYPYTLLKGLFPYLVLCQPLRYEQPPRQEGLDTWSNPRPWPRLSAEIKHAQVNNKYKAITPDHTVYRTAVTPHSVRPPPVLRAAPPEAINRIAYGFRRADKHFPVFSSTTVLALSSINLGTWDPSLSRSGCIPYYKHLGASNISLIPLYWKQGLFLLEPW
jgi:hypothetical protein